MQGRCEAGVSRGQVLEWLGEALEELSGQSARHNQVLLFEPLNRYETDVFTRQGEAAAFLAHFEAPKTSGCCAICFT